MPHTIRTERLLLRPPSPRDARAFAFVLNDWDILSKTGTWSYPLSREGAAFRLRQAALMEPLTDHVFLIFDGLGFAGTCGIHQRRGDVFSIGYMLGKKYWGHGLATEALRAVCKFGFRTVGAKTIVGDAFLDNPASARVMQKVGMRMTGKGPGWSAARRARFPMGSYAMTRTEFRP